MAQITHRARVLDIRDVPRYPGWVEWMTGYLDQTHETTSDMTLTEQRASPWWHYQGWYLCDWRGHCCWLNMFPSLVQSETRWNVHLLAGRWTDVPLTEGGQPNVIHLLHYHDYRHEVNDVDIHEARRVFRRYFNKLDLVMLERKFGG